MATAPERPQWWDAKITQLGGTNYKGEPNLRTVWGLDERKLNGQLKYPNPENPQKGMNCWILEVWMPPEFFGDPAEWNEELCGPFPREGFYGMKTPLMFGDGQYVPLTDATFESIQKYEFASIEWSELNAKDRYEHLASIQSKREKEAQERASKEFNDTLDQYYHHAEHESNSDNRVYVFPDAVTPNVTGIRRSNADR